MGETETLSNLQMLIDALRLSPAPVDRQLWDSLDVSRYLRRGTRIYSIFNALQTLCVNTAKNIIQIRTFSVNGQDPFGQ